MANEYSDVDVSVNESLLINYQPVSVVPGFEIEIRDDAFWAPIAHRTRTHAHLKSIEN